MSSTNTKTLFHAYLELCKPKVVALMLLTAIIGMMLATQNAVTWSTLLFGTLGIALSASAAATINHVVDYRIDAVMNRTQQRPLPSGLITPNQALIFAGILGTLGMAVLIIFINTLTALLTLFTLIGYAGIYTMYLKRTTPQNIVIGGTAGAAPPLLGWTAVTNHIDPHSLLLVLIIFVWTPPHFWALAIHRYAEYAKAKIPMLPVTHGIPFTKLSILLYTILLVIITLLPFATGMSGIIYLAGAILLDIGFLYFAIRLKYTAENIPNKIAIHTFYYSIFYLAAIFIFLLIDHYVKI